MEQSFRGSVADTTLIAVVLVVLGSIAFHGSGAPAVTGFYRGVGGRVAPAASGR